MPKNEPKWKGMWVENSSKRSKTSHGTNSSASNPNSPIDYSEYDSAVPTAHPMVQKAEKMKSRGKATASTTHFVDLTGMENAADRK